ncbi:hypothetical protein ACI77I_06765 [Pseudomonas sp. D47]|uniref:hypothetical protein n=1 Tax=Pseudomonas sp. D47 TaxID=3159447 RepID=UPI00387B1247
MNSSPSVITHVSGEPMRAVLLDAQQMCSMNFARDEFDKLSRILQPLLDTMLCRQDEGPACDIARHLEQIRIFSGNFLVRHRDLGASFGVVGSRPGIDVEVRP